jgi:dolichol kinase
MWDYRKEIGRKFIHLLSLLYLLAYIGVAYLFNNDIALLFMVFLLTLALTLEYIRLEHHPDMPIFSFLYMFRRQKERDKVGADIFFLLGIIICIAVFNFNIAVAAILMTTFGDLASALVGPKGKILIPFLNYKSLEGALAEFLVDLAAGLLILGYHLWPVAVVMATTATTVETFTSKIDDNLLIPVFAGFNGQIALLILMAMT